MLSAFFDKPLILNLRFQIPDSKDGGEGGIRTHGTVPRSQHFQCCQFNHSCTSPRGEFRISDCELRNSENQPAKKPKTPWFKNKSAIRIPQSEISSSVHAAPRDHLVVLVHQLIGRPFDHPAGGSADPTPLHTCEGLLVANAAHQLFRSLQEIVTARHIKTSQRSLRSEERRVGKRVW